MNPASAEPFGDLQPCLLAATGTGIIALVAARAWFPASTVYWGILVGWGLAAVNTVSLIKIIAGMLKPGRGKIVLGGLLGIKMLGVLGAVFLVLKYLPIDGMALAAGYLAALLGAVGLHFLRSLAAGLMLGCIVLSLIVPAFPLAAKKLPPGANTLTKPQTRLEKHFDLNDDGFLDLRERQLVRTRAHFKTPLVTRKKQLPYDANKDRMLSADEWHLYSRDKKTGRLDDVYETYQSKERAK